MVFVYEVFRDEPGTLHDFSDVLHGFENFFSLGKIKFRRVALLRLHLGVARQRHHHVPQFRCFPESPNMPVVNERRGHIRHDAGAFCWGRYGLHTSPEESMTGRI